MSEGSLGTTIAIQPRMLPILVPQIQWTYYRHTVGSLFFITPT
jgi:hypothetical protein